MNPPRNHPQTLHPVPVPTHHAPHHSPQGQVRRARSKSKSKSKNETRPPPPPPAATSRLTQTINKKTDEALSHAGIKINELREEQQAGMSEWISSELVRFNESTAKFLADSQRETQDEASKWLEREMQRAPRVFLGATRDVVVGWLTGEEGVLTAALAWIPVVLVTGQTVKMGVDLARGVYGVLNDPRRRRALGL